MTNSFYRIFVLFLIIGKFQNSHGFFWPFTLWNKSSSSNSQPSFTDLLFRPYFDDLTPLPSNADPSVINELISSSPQNLGTLNENHVGIQTESLDQTNVTPENDHQTQWFGRQFGMGNHQQQIGLQMRDGHFYSENFLDPKRINYINKFKQSTNNNPMTVESINSKYIYPIESQYLIIQKPPIQQQLTQTDRGEMLEENNNANIQPSNQQIISPFKGNNWVYLSPVNKLNSQQQPIILETYVEPNNNQIQSFAIKNVKSKQMTPPRTMVGIKFPLLSWLPASSNIQFPFWFKAKQHPQTQENQDNHQQQKYYQTSNSFVTSPNVNHRPMYIYNPGSSLINNAGSTSGTYYLQTPVHTPAGTNTMIQSSGNSVDAGEPNAQTLLSSELMNETNSTSISLIQQQTSTNHQQPSHRIVYQALSQPTSNIPNSTMTNVNGRSLYNNQFQPIYQLIHSGPMEGLSSSGTGINSWTTTQSNFTSQN